MTQFWNQLPTGVKFAAIAIISVLVTVGAVNPEVLNVLGFSQSQGPETIQVEFNIYSKDTNDPIERAEVQFIFDGAPEPRVTNTDGYVRIEIPTRDDVDVIIKKEGFLDLNRTINLAADPNRTVIYFLETDENYRTYNLFGDGFEAGFSFNGKKTETLSVSFVEGSFDSPVRESPFTKLTVDKSKNEESRYKIIDSENGIPLTISEILNDSQIALLGSLEVGYSANEKPYKYNGSISESGLLIGKEIIHENKDGAWLVDLAGGANTELEQIEVDEYSSWNSLFLNYPRNPVKIGESWDLTQYILATDGITDGSATATFSEVTEYEGEPAALITIEGSWVDKGGGNDDDDPSFEGMLFQELSRSLLKKMAVGYAEIYVINDIKKTVVDDLYYDDFSLTLDDGKLRGLIDTLVRVYQDADNNPDLPYYEFSEIERYVDEKFAEYSVPNLVVKITEDSLETGLFTDDSDEDEDDGFSTEGTLSGKVYRSLRNPIDLYHEMKFVGNTIGDSQPGKFEAELISTFNR